MGLLTLSPTNIAIAGVLFVVYTIGLYIYRAFFDSLSHIPGPKLAAATLWYEFYYDVIKAGRYTWKIGEMHEQYGRIVRISPYEVHIHDPDFIDTVYPGSTVRTEKYPWAMRMFGLDQAFLVTPNHELHRLKRNAFAHYLSKATLQRLEPAVMSVIDIMLARMHALKGTGKVVNMLDMYACMTADVVGQYAFAEPYGLLEDPDFSPHWHDTLMDVSKNGHVAKQFGFLLPMMKTMPDWMVKLTAPGTMTLINFQRNFRRLVIEAKKNIAEDNIPKGQSNIFYDVLTNPEVRPQEKDTDYLQDEAQTIIGAGTVTTAHILALLHFYIHSNPPVKQRLQSELSTLQSTNPKPKWVQLEQLPYLAAVITEGLRIGYGVAGRLQRCFPDNVIEYNGYAIPKMTPISMSAKLIHDDPSIFPEPRTFRPERFLEHPELKKYLVPFSKGSRQCAGMNLAYMELYLAVAAMWAKGRFEWSVWDTERDRDVETHHDFLNTSAKLGSKGIRFTVD